MKLDSSGCAAVGFLAAMGAFLSVAMVWEPESVLQSPADRIARDAADAQTPGRSSDTSGSDSALRDPVASLGATPSGSIRGRCVGAEHGLELQDVAVEWWVGERRGAVCGPSYFSCTVPAGRVRVVVRVPHRAELIGQVLVRAGGEVDLGELRMRRAARIRGSLRALDGAPVAGARLHVYVRGRPYRTGPLAEWTPPIVTTARDGTFQLPRGLAAGAYRVVARGAPPIEEGATFEIVDGQEEASLALVCVASGPGDEIHGTVVGARGEPTPGAVVQAWTESGKSAGAARTGADGAFRLYRPRFATAEEAVRLSVAAAQQSAIGSRAVEARWGDEGVTLALDPGRRVRVEVLDARGEPVERFAVQCIPMTGMRAIRDCRLQVEGDHPDGVAFVSAPRKGPHRLVVHPLGSFATRFRPSLPQIIDVPEHGHGDIRVVLPATERCEVLVGFPDGSRATQSRVEVFVLEGLDAISETMVVTDLDRFFENGGTRGPFAIRVADVQTDGQGLASVPWHTSAQPLAVRVTGDHVEWRGAGIVFSVKEPALRVRVAHAARISGEFHPTSHLRHVHLADRGDWERYDHLLDTEGEGTAESFFRRFAGGVILVSEDGRTRVPYGRREHIPIRRDGSFSISGVPPGGWEVHLVTRLPSGAFEEWPEPFAKVWLRAGEKSVLRTDLRRVVEPGELIGELSQDGRPVGDAALILTYRPPNGGRRVVAETRTRSDGQFRIRDLPPRHLRLEMRIRGETQRVSEVSIPAGQTVRRVFVLPPTKTKG